MNFDSKTTIYVAVGIVAVGFVVIFLGWNGAAERDFVEGQLPYVISGGITGLGIVAIGIAVAVVEARRRDTAELVAKIDRLLEHLGDDVDGAAARTPDQVGSFRESRAKKATGGSAGSARSAGSGGSAGSSRTGRSRRSKTGKAPRRARTKAT